MFNEVQGQLNSSKCIFSEKVNDSFGDAILKDAYEPFERELEKLNFAWNEAEVKKMEIMSLLMELRTIF